MGSGIPSSFLGEETTDPRGIAIVIATFGDQGCCDQDFFAHMGSGIHSSFIGEEVLWSISEYHV